MEASVEKAMSDMYLSKGFHAEALKLKTRELASVKMIGTGSSAITPGTFADAKQALASQRDKGDRNGEAYALNAFANACIVEGEHQNAIRAAMEALAIYKELG